MYIMVSKSCGKGQIRRKGYTAKRKGKNIRVASSCIKATSASGSKRSNLDKAYLKKRAKIQKEIGKKYGHKKCATGQMERAGYSKKPYNRKSYTRKNGSRVKKAYVSASEVPPTCIDRKGARVPPGKKKFKIPMVLEKGVLKKYGYANVKKLSMEERHTAIKKAVEKIKNPLSLFRKLVAVSTMNKKTNPGTAKIFKEDALWIKSHFGLMKTEPTSKGGGKKSRSKSSKSKSSKSKSSKSKSSKSKHKKMAGGAKKRKSTSKTSRPKSSKSKSKKMTGGAKKRKSTSKTSRPKTRKHSTKKRSSGSKSAKKR